MSASDYVRFYLARKPWRYRYVEAGRFWKIRPAAVIQVNPAPFGSYYWIMNSSRDPDSVCLGALLNQRKFWNRTFTLEKRRL